MTHYFRCPGARDDQSCNVGPLGPHVGIRRMSNIKNFIDKYKVLEGSSKTVGRVREIAKRWASDRGSQTLLCVLFFRILND